MYGKRAGVKRVMDTVWTGIVNNVLANVSVTAWEEVKGDVLNRVRREVRNRINTTNGEPIFKALPSP